MAQERAQSLLIPQPGYLLAQPGFTSIPPLPPTFATLAQNPPFMRPHLSPSPSAYSEPITQSASHRPNQFSTNDSDSQDRDYQIISYDELERLLPDPKPAERADLVGVLENGCAYAPKSASRDQYLLFQSKLGYVRYFTHYYFSRENLSRDMTFVNMLINRMILPVERLVQAPRLAAIDTTFKDVEEALGQSSVVCVEDIGIGMRGVRRIDGYPASVLTSEESATAYTQYETAGDSFPSPTGSFSVSTSVRTQDLRQTFPQAASTYPVDGISEHTEPSAPPKCLPSVPFVVEQNAFSASTCSLGDPISFLCNVPPNYVPAPSSHISVSSPHTSSTLNSLPDQPLVASEGLMISTPTCTPSAPSTTTARPTLWPSHHQTHFLGGYQRHSLPSGSSNAAGDSNHLTCTPQPSSLLGFSTRLPYHPANTPLELQPIPMSSVRQPPILPQYIMRNSGHGPAAYHSTLSFGSGATSTNPMNLAAPSAVPHQAQVHLNHAAYPPFPGHMLPAVSNHIVAPSHPAVAALVAAQQQQVYFGAQGYSTNTHHAPLHRAAPSQLPLLYASNPISLPQLPRTHHQFHRLQPGPVYAVYQPPQQSALLQNPLQVNSELVKGDTAPTYNQPTAHAQASNSITYPILLPQHFTFHQQFNNAHSHNFSMSELASAASNLWIQNPPKTRPLQNISLNNLSGTAAVSQVPANTETNAPTLGSVSPSVDGCGEVFEESCPTSLPCCGTQVICNSPAVTPVSSAVTSDFSTGEYTDTSLTTNSLTDTNRSSGMTTGHIKRSGSENSSHGSVSSGIDDTSSPSSTNAGAGTDPSSVPRPPCSLSSLSYPEPINRHRL